MAYFGESLVGIASEWYMNQEIVRQFQRNVDIDLDRNSFSNLKKKTAKVSVNMVSIGASKPPG